MLPKTRILSIRIFEHENCLILIPYSCVIKRISRINAHPLPVFTTRSISVVQTLCISINAHRDIKRTFSSCGDISACA